jgi:hypothetical protein
VCAPTSSESVLTGAILPGRLRLIDFTS